MWKSGLIIGIGALIISLTLAVTVSPLCPPCIMIFLGLGAGYLAGLFVKPLDQTAAQKQGAWAGAIAGIGAALGQIIAAIVNATLIGPETIQDLLKQLGLPASNDPNMYYTGVVGAACCTTSLDVALLTGFGVVGGILWWKMTGSKQIV